MTLIELQKKLKTLVRAAALQRWGVELTEVNAEAPKQIEMGDIAFPVAFELAKLIKQGTGVKLAPRAIAEELKRALQVVDDVTTIEVAGAGYLNIFLDRASLLAQFSAKSSEQAADLAVEQPKKMVEHTSINPNKAAHIGHVRNAVLGDTFVRILQAAGDRVEVQNYIDNTGVQVADVVVGFMHIRGLNLDEIKALDLSLPSESVVRLLLLGSLHASWDLLSRRRPEWRTKSGEAETAQRSSPRAGRRKQTRLPSSPIMWRRVTSNAFSTRWSASAFVTICWRASLTFCTCTFGIVPSS